MCTMKSGEGDLSPCMSWVTSHQALQGIYKTLCSGLLGLDEVGRILCTFF